MSTRRPAKDRALGLALLGLGAIGCPNRPPEPLLDLAEVVAVAERKDYFALGALVKRDSSSSPAVLVARALVAHAFNQLDESTALIRAATARGGLSDSLTFRLRELETTNLLRRFQYAEALRAADLALDRAAGSLDTSVTNDLRNLRKIALVLAPYPAQTVARRALTRVRLTEGHVDVTVNDSARRYIFDTGANLSTMARSEAAALGIRILSAGIDVGASTGRKNTADLAIADRLTIGGLDFRNVVFLVFDDELLTVPGMRIRGIVGFPVVDAMGEIQLRSSGELHVPLQTPAHATRNLAISGHTPLTTVTWRGDTLLCRLDTGASTTDFYHPFYAAHKTWVDSSGRPRVAQTAGVGGMRAVPAYELTGMPLGIGDTTFVLPRAHVFTPSLVSTPSEDYLACNVGHDIFDAFTEYVFNFRSMSFLLR